MSTNTLKIDISIKLETAHDLFRYFEEVFEQSITDTIRFYSIHSGLSNNRNSLIGVDYYNLTMISLRKLFEPKMESSISINENPVEARPLKFDYQLNFLQWINNFYKMYDTLRTKTSFSENNISNIRISLLNFKKALQRFEKVNNDKTIINDGVNTTYPLRTRVYNYASKYVAHSIPSSSIEKWEYNNEVFLYDKELSELVEVISLIQDQHRNLMYYWNNVVKMETFDYSQTLDDKIKKHFTEFLNELSKYYK